MGGDDGLSDVVDWGDGEDEEQPQEPAESQTEGADADAISLASDGDDLETLKKYHDQTWNDPASVREAQQPARAPESVVEPSIPAAEPSTASKTTQETNVHQSGKVTPQNIPGLPPKPVSPVFTRVASTAVSMSATAMAPREARPNGNTRGGEERDQSQRLPPGWERRTSRKGETYYYDTAAGTTQWDYPAPPKAANRPQVDSRDDSSRRDKDSVGSTREAPSGGRRSRSRERRPIRRSPSPRPGNNRPRSRSLDRSYRPPRAPSPRREPIRPSREANHSRRSPPPRERPLSPRPYARQDARARSPGHPREESDNYRRDRRQEPIQSSRHRSPPPRSHSQERSSYRSIAPTKEYMDIDHYEPPSHGAVRRRRSWDPLDTSDIKRRRVDASPPPPLPLPPPTVRNIDRYVPDRKSNRMDVDSPKPRQESTRSHPLDNQPSRDRSHRDPPPHARSRDINGGTVSDRELPSSKLLPRRSPSPNSRNQGSQQTAVSQRSKAPLPPQSAAMRMGNSDRARPVPMDIDNPRENARPSNSEVAPKAPRADRGRGNNYSDRAEPPRERSPHVRPPRDERGSSRQEVPRRTESGNDRARRGEHPSDSRDRVNGLNPDNGWQRPLPPSDGTRDGHRGRGRGSRQATSGSNNIPIHQSTGRFIPPASSDDYAPRVTEREPAPGRPIDPLSDSQQDIPDHSKKPRQSRFGPPTATPQSDGDLLLPGNHSPPPNDEDLPPNQSESVSENIEPSNQPQDQSSALPVREDDQSESGFKRDLPPHVSQSDTQVEDAPPAPPPPRPRINRDRVSRSEGHRRQSSFPHADAAPPTPTHLPYDDAAVGVENVENQGTGSPIDTRLETQVDTEQAPSQIEKPEPARKGSLLERIGLGPMNGQAAEDGHAEYSTGERGRGRRGKRPPRGSRR